MSSARFSASFPAPAGIPATALPTVLAVGERLGVWRIAAALHGGDSGRWYRAEHSLAPGQSAAVLVYQQSADAAGVLLRFAELAGALSQLEHPVLATPLDSGLTPEGKPYLVLPWQDGQALLAASAVLPLRQRLQLLLPICEALQYAHEQGLLLRELDPGLLWLGADQQPRLMALGLAELAPEPDAPPPQFSAAAIAFVAPELQRGAQPSLGSEAYALGVLACWLVSGRAPKIDANGVLQPSAASMASLTTAERFSLEALLQKATAPTSVMRHPSARELGEDLRAWLAGQNHSALVLHPMPAPNPAPASLSTPPLMQPRRKGWRSLLLVAGLAVLAAGGWAGHLVYQRQDLAPTVPAAPAARP